MTVVVALLASTAVGGTASAGPSGGALPPVLIEALQIGGEYGVPADAAMVAATITAIDPFENGWIKAFPCDAEPPDTANLNYAADQIANNLVLARLSTDGRLCIATRSLTDYVVDVAGYVPAGSTITPLPSPVRALDTRNGTGGSNASPVPDGDTVELLLGDAHGIPKTATLAVFNLTAVGGPTGGRITAHPCDEAPGTTSSVNFPAGRNVANLVVSRLSSDGTVCLLAKNASDMVVDVAGYATEGITTLPTPRRVLDTRSRGGVLGADSSVTVDPSLPGDATAAIYNLTAVDAPGRGFATAHPCDEDRPTSSNLNFNGPQAVGAGSITKLDADGTFCLFAKSPVNLIVDLIGYTTDAATYVPMSPVRIKDTRDGWASTCPWIVGKRSLFDGVIAYNVRTDRYAEFEVPTADWPGLIGPTPIVDRACTGVYALGVQSVLHIGFDGSVSKTPIPDVDGDPWFIGEIEALHEGDDGTVFILREQLTDLSTRETSGPVYPTERADLGAFLADLDISQNGEIVALVYASFEVERSWLVVHDAETGAVISETPMDGTSLTVDVSHDGTYITLDILPVGEDQVGFTVVHTLFGDVVDGALGTRAIPASVFIGNGEIVAWVGGFGLFRWDLYGPLEFIGGLEHPFMAAFEGSVGH